MLRLATLMSLAMAALSPAFAADQIVTPQVKRHARVILPPGLPRAHYRYQTTLVYKAAPPPPPVVVVEPNPDVLITSGPSTPLLPGSTTLPGYYGRPFDYDYQGPYYGGGPYPSYFWRLPYACGVYGYC
ncbi:hypothetical protein [Bradyrhizobium sp. STM 3562]|uniref:hypothetical protein n=1 Tax=Bradyrhizobium sp. STM 3562 TaxID=578924 RepID=UPI00388E5130